MGEAAEALAKRLEALQLRVAKLEEETPIITPTEPTAKIQGDEHPSIQRVKAGGGDESSLAIELLVAERDKAVAEVALLKKAIAKQEYRIMHLVRALNQQEEAAATR